MIIPPCLQLAISPNDHNNLDNNNNNNWSVDCPVMTSIGPSSDRHQMSAGTLTMFCCYGLCPSLLSAPSPIYIGQRATIHKDFFQSVHETPGNNGTRQATLIMAICMRAARESFPPRNIYTQSRDLDQWGGCHYTESTRWCLMDKPCAPPKRSL